MPRFSIHFLLVGSVKRFSIDYFADRNCEDQKVAAPLTRHGDFAELKIDLAYFLPALFAAQKAFNLADNFALVAALTVVLLGLAAGLTGSVARLER